MTGLRPGTFFAMPSGMAHSAAASGSYRQPVLDEDAAADGGERLRIGADCLELNASTPEELNELRAWIRRINGTTYAQPYLVEGPPGHFRLYVGEAAERVRTQQGIR